jgi:hypothetical protein
MFCGQNAKNLQQNDKTTSDTDETAHFHVKKLGGRDSTQVGVLFEVDFVF